MAVKSQAAAAARADERSGAEARVVPFAEAFRFWVRLGFISFGGADFFALAVSAAAFLALYRFKADVLWVVLTGGALGLAWTLLSA